MRIVLATLVVAGCSFEHGVDPAGLLDGGPVVDPSGDAGVTQAGPCKMPDSALRLCVEFEDRKYSPTISDTSPYHHNVMADELGEWERNNMPAAASYWNTEVRVPETPMLDISGSITFEMWMRAPSYQVATLLSNDGQYAIGMDFSGRVTCRVGGATATSDPIGTDVWRHISCTHSGDKIAIHIDGVATKCQDSVEVIPTSGTQGLKIAPAFTGAIDDIHVYARKLSATEICTHADKQTCASSCLDD